MYYYGIFAYGYHADHNSHKINYTNEMILGGGGGATNKQINKI